MTKFVVNPYDPSDLPCELCSPEPQEVGQEPAGAHVGPEMAPDIQKRLIALCEAVAGTPRNLIAEGDEARAIMEAMKPVDSDKVAAIDLLARMADETDGNGDLYRNGLMDSSSSVRIAKAAIALGRQLEREGK